MANVYTQILRQGTYAQYQALTTKDANLLYFCTDNGKLYKGSVDFTDNFVVVTAATLPTTGVAGKIYYESDTKKFKTYIGSAYVDITFPVDTYTDASIGKNSDENHVPTSKNVYEYGQVIKSEVIGGKDVVKNIVAGSTAATETITYGDNTTGTVTVPGVATGLAATTDAAKVSLTMSTGNAVNVVVPGVATGISASKDAAKVSLTMSTGSAVDVVVPGVITAVANKASVDGAIDVTDSAGNTSEVLVSGVVTTPTWDASSRVLTLPVAGGTSVEVNIGKDIFLDPDADNKYDPETNQIILYLNDGAGGEPTKIEIPVAGMIPVYSGASTTTATVAIDKSLAISANVKVDKHTGNAITIASDTEDGEGNTITGGLRVDLTAYATTAQLQTLTDGAVKTNTDNIAALAAATTAWGSFS
jgi:hypothetical protein